MSFRSRSTIRVPQAPFLVLLFLCSGLMHVGPARAQQPLQGTVVDGETEQPLPGVNVQVRDRDIGTATNAEGRFQLPLPPGATELTFSHVGYRTRTVAVDRDLDTLHVALFPQQLSLQQLIVSASRYEERRSEAPSAVSVLGASDLEAQRPNQLHEALSTLPGVRMTDLGNEQHAMSIRQPVTYKAVYAYLEDGLPIRPMGVFNHNALIEVNMAGAERIEVVRGPSSALYGSNAIGGAVNVITPQAEEDRAASLSLRGHQHGFVRADGEASATVGELGLWTGGYAALQREGWNEHSDYDKASITARADYALATETKLTATFSSNHLLTETDGDLDSLSFYERGFTSLQTFTYRQVDASRLTARLQHAWNEGHYSEVAAFWRRTAIGQLPHYRIARDPADPSRADGEENEDRFWSLGLHAQHELHFQPADAQLTLGTYLDRSPNRHEAHYLDIERDPESGRFTDYTRRDSLLTDYQVLLGNAAGYAQLSLHPLRRLRLVGSLRYDFVAYDYDNFLPPSAFSGAPDERSTFAHLSPRLGVTYELGRSRSLYANYSRGFMPPEVNELYRGVSVPALRSAYFDSYEVGAFFTALSERLQAEVSLYWMEGTDEIISVRQEDDTTVNRNAGATRHRGVEYGLAAAPTPELTLRLTGTNAEHRFLRFEERGQRLDGNVMDNAPGWTASFAAIYEPGFLPGAHLRLGIERIGSYYMDPQNTMRYDGHTLLHGQASYRMEDLKVWLSARNLTNALYATTASKAPWGQQYHPGAPRTLTLGLRYHFLR